MEEITGRHFLQTAERAGLPESLARNALEEVAAAAAGAIQTVERELPTGFPDEIHHAVKKALKSRLQNL
jgi:serine/threonine-protein kinase HipA